MVDQILNASDWWRGLSREQRAGGPPDVSEEDREHGRRRRAAWSGGFILRGTDISLDRWERAGVTEDQVVDLLAEPAAALAARRPGRPAWLDVIAEAWQRFGTAGLPDVDVHRGHRHGERDGSANTAFLHLIAPLLAWGRAELRDQVAALADLADPAGAHPPATPGTESPGPVPPIPADHPLFEPPLGRLLYMITPVMVLEVNVARMEGRLTGHTPAERMASFVAEIAEPTNALRLLAEYPVLARELVTCVRTAVRVRTEFARRLLADLPALRETFGGNWQGLADLADVTFGAGDTHRGGRTVAVLTFTDGRRLVYKPRGLSVEVHFNEVLDWLNASGLRHPMRLLRVLDRDGYGWVEHVAVASCQDEGQVERFFWRQGAHLALFHALCGSDMHLENVIAAGEHPVLIDLEALFQVPPRLTGPPPLVLGEAPKIMRDSVLRIGLLPERIITADEEGIYDAEVSGLAGGGGQLSPARLPTYVASGTDEVHAVRDRQEMPETENRARLNGQPVSAQAHTETLAAGFEECYRIITAGRDDLVGEHGLLARFRTDEVRFIPRPTMTYARLQAESWHPDLLRDSLDREIFFEVLAAGLPEVPDRDRMLASEQRQLADQDVPSFHTTPDSTNLCDAHGVVARDLLESSGLAAVHARIAGMSEEDLRRQLWCIRASMSGLTVGTPSADDIEPRPLPGTPLDRDLALRAASTVADLLLDAALVAEGEAPSWLSVNFVGDRYWTVGHAGLDLYSGVPGVALFLGHLGTLSGQARFRRPAEQIAGQLLDVTNRLVADTDRGPMPIGGFDELGGLLYVLSQLGALWRESELLDAADQLARMCQERFAEDRFLDVISGTAGAALAILALHRARPDEWAVQALATAAATLEQRAVEVPGGRAWLAEFERDQALLGFAHGASGIAYTLARIVEVTGEEQYLDLCGQALGFERHHLCRARGNWPDLRSLSGPDAFMDAWCHGAAGIGIARAAMLGRPGLAPWHDLIREDLDIAAATVRADLVVDGWYSGIGNDSICHGDLGLVEALLSAGPALGRPDLAPLGGCAARAVADQVLAGHPRPGVPRGVSTPGLLMGLAGIGYGLLRAALPHQIPNVLLLDVPGDPEGPTDAGQAAPRRIATAI